MRLLLVGGSELTAWVVRRLVPSGVEVERCDTIAEARETLVDAPPQAAIFDVSRSRVPWRSLADLCNRHEPRIPFLCYSVIHSESFETGVQPCCEEFFTLPEPLDDLRARLESLIEIARAESARPQDGTAGSARHTPDTD